MAHRNLGEMWSQLPANVGDGVHDDTQSLLDSLLLDPVVVSTVLNRALSGTGQSGPASGFTPPLWSAQLPTRVKTPQPVNAGPYRAAVVTPTQVAEIVQVLLLPCHEAQHQVDVLVSPDSEVRVTHTTSRRSPEGGHEMDSWDYYSAEHNRPLEASLRAFLDRVHGEHLEPSATLRVVTYVPTPAPRTLSDFMVGPEDLRPEDRE